LVERDEVAFISSQLGTPGNPASAKYLALKCASSIALTSGSNKFSNVANFPRATARLVSLDTGGKIYAATGKRSTSDRNEVAEGGVIELDGENP
jgi:branched-chain amino acid transport system substrate-binding protein